MYTEHFTIYIVFILISYFINYYFFFKKNNKNASIRYECGIKSNNIISFHLTSKMYRYILIFILFDIEIILMLPCFIIFDKENVISTQYNNIYKISIFAIPIILVLFLIIYNSKEKKYSKKQFPKLLCTIPKKMYNNINKKF
ncbi:MAG: NADH-quinone oxidoreductase subunit A [Bacteroides sp.]|nr:MAG: NADH-quinone oxidoreductase subunit A [Bacteroides sp.]